MNSVIEHLNAWGAEAVSLCWPLLWQSSLLIAFMLLTEWALKRKLRPAMRYGLWLVVLVKLVLPPSLAFPTGLAWWVRPQAHTHRHVFNRPAGVTYGTILAPVASGTLNVPEFSKPRLSLAGGMLAGSTAVSLVFLAFLWWRWREMARQSAAGNRSSTPASVAEVLAEACEAMRIRRRPAVRLLDRPMSPALFGLLRPAILLPDSLVRRLSRPQLRSVLLHELVHLRRGDVWVNCVQTLLQILYWWHPLLWVANHRIRRVREEAVDEAVMVALRGEADSYAPTLLEVARLALARPLASLGLVGILESRGALRQRIERLIDFCPPRRTGRTVVSALCAVAFGAAALPMGQAPENPYTSAKSQDEHAGQISASDIDGNENKPDAKALVQDGKLLYEMGKLDEAEKKFILVLRQDPREQAAYYYLNLIKQARYKQQRRGLRDVTSGRQRIYSKLDKLRLDRIEFDRVPLSEVVKILAEQAKRKDPSGEGINFILNREKLTSTDTHVNDVGEVSVRILPYLTNVRFADVLDAVVKVADAPIKYSIEDYGVVFSFKGNEAPPLYVRVIKVDPNTFEMGLRSVTGHTETGDKEKPITFLREFLASINVDLSAPKSIFWNDREGTLVLRATLQDLDTIETAVQVLSLAPPQVNIKARFVELPDDVEAAFWQKRSGANQDTSAARMVQLPRDEAQRQLEEWESKGSGDLLSESSITTLSGRQSQIQVVLGLTNLITWTNVSKGTWETQTNVMSLGPTLDVLPTVSADMLRWDLAMTASVTEFLGYDDPGQFAVSTDQVSHPQLAALPVPHFRLRQLPVTATVWDGYTLILGGALEQGRLEDKAGEHVNKRLLVLVTPTLIDPAGNRVHTDEEVEHARVGSGKLTTPQWYPTLPPRRAN